MKKQHWQSLVAQKLQLRMYLGSKHFFPLKMLSAEGGMASLEKRNLEILRKRNGYWVAKLTVQTLRSWSFGQWGASEGFNLGIECLRLNLGTRIEKGAGNRDRVLKN